ncbi:MAG: hypothetical protein ABFD83_12040 [Armatimonadota bacterium]
MKKLFPETPDVPQTQANRAARIIEKHMRMHRVEKAKDLPEEARIRLYRDLRFLFDGGEQPPVVGGRFCIRSFFSRIWEKLEDFLSAYEADRSDTVNLLAWVSIGESARLALVTMCCPPRVGRESG